MNVQATEVLISASVSMGVATSIDASPLFTALITLGVSIVTAVGAEVVKYLVAYFKNKTKKLEDDTNKLDDKGDNNG